MEVVCVHGFPGFPEMKDFSQMTEFFEFQRVKFGCYDPDGVHMEEACLFEFVVYEIGGFFVLEHARGLVEIIAGDRLVWYGFLGEYE